MVKITASHLYNFIQCPHRVWRDAHDDKRLRDEPNEFVKMLWERGTQYENEVMEQMEGSEQVCDLSVLPIAERTAATLEALDRKEPLIYHGRLDIDDLLGEPDLLELQPDGEYVPVDIKSGMALEGSDAFTEGKPKKHYALQLALYVDALRRMGFSTGYRAKIFDSSGALVEYNLDKSRSSRAKDTWWELYEDALVVAGNVLKKKIQTKPALGSTCKLCVWYSDCKQSCVKGNVLSLIPELGRTKQEALYGIVSTVEELAVLKVDEHADAKGNTGIPGLRKPSLEKFQRRAEVLSSGQKEPLILKQFSLPDNPIELHFDIEADPTRDLIYMHGVVERRMDDPDNAKFHAFVAKGITRSDEKQAWKEFWDYIHSLPRGGFAVYYYSKYERTQYRALQKRYPDVVTEDEVEAFFEDEASIDLYFDLVKPCTDWATYNYSVKTLAQHLGFSWRDPNPSGAASIQWFNEWCEDRSDEKMQRILDYNEDDCRAMIVLKDELLKYAS